jgi:hypothetical protein
MDNIYPVLAEHQVTEPWKYQGLAKELHRWAGIINVQCRLDVPNISLRIDRVRARALGLYRIGHNGLGLTNEITLNERHLPRLEPWLILAILLHEMVHAWQHTHGKPSGWYHHNVEFRDKLASFGIQCDRRGAHVAYNRSGLFFRLLAEHDIAALKVPNCLGTVRVARQCHTWSCGCTRARTTTVDLAAACLRCGRRFILVN